MEEFQKLGLLLNFNTKQGKVQTKKGKTARYTLSQYARSQSHLDLSIFNPE